MMKSRMAIVAALALAGCNDADDHHEHGAPQADARPMTKPSADAGIQRDAAPPQETCSTVVQDCMNPLKPKCTIVFEGVEIDTECVAQAGTVGRDQSCTRTNPGNPGVGRDDCAMGLFCSGMGFPQDMSGAATMRACREFCYEGSTCAAGEACAALDNLTPQNGLCMKTCALFGADCAAGTSCSISSLTGEEMYVGLCRSTGTAAAGAACESSTDCQANLQCLFGDHGSGACGSLCDEAHPCSAGSCMAIPGLPAAGGFCQSAE